MKRMGMNNKVLATLLGGLALLATSCTFFDSFDEDLVEAHIAKHSSESSDSSQTDVFVSSDSEDMSSSADDVSSSSKEEESSSSEEISSSSFSCDESFNDNRSNAVTKTYKLTAIGKQCWFAENLNYDMPESFCYGDDAENCKKYGRLYSWLDAVEACPEGSHLASNEEWEVLKKYISSGRADVAGFALKDNSGWLNDGNGSNEYGFSAIPGGYYNADTESYKSEGSQGFWWTSSEGTNGNLYGLFWYLKSTSKELSSMEQLKPYALSVRCILD